MTLLPIVERELRVAARRAGTFWTRLVVAVVAVFIAAVVFLVTLGLPPDRVGRNIFEWLSGLLLGYCLSYGRLSTADSLSEEKRQGTLGLLFLTDLKGLDVVLGKLAATSLGGFYGLLAVLPVLAVPMLLGGVSNAEFWRVVLVLVDTFFFSLAVGLVGSSLSKDYRRALGNNFLLLLLIVGGPPACAVAIVFFAHWLGYTVSFFQPPFYSCPVYSLILCSDTVYKVHADDFWISVTVIQLLSWLLVFLAAWVVPRTWQDRPMQLSASRWRPESGSARSSGVSWLFAPGTGLRHLWQLWRFGPAVALPAFRKRLLDINAFYWLAARVRFKPVHVWVFLAGMAFWWVIGLVSNGVLWTDYSVTILTALLLNSALKMWIGIEAGQRLAEEQKSGSFELLLSAPLTIGDVLGGQWLALKRQFLWPLVAVCVIELLLLLVPHHQLQGVMVPWGILAGLVMLVADVAALSWVAMWRALVSRSHNRATIATFVRVLMLPWAMFGAIVAGQNLRYLVLTGREWLPGEAFYIWLWLALGLAVDIVYGLFAWRQMRYGFRQLALRPFNPEPSRVARLFGRVPERAKEPATDFSGSRLRTDDARSKEVSSVSSATSGSVDRPKIQTENRQNLLEIRPAHDARRYSHFRFRWKYLVVIMLGVVIALIGIFAAKSHKHSEQALVINISQSNAPVRVFPSSQGAYFILPDGSLWLWGEASWRGGARRNIPQRVESDNDWMQIAGGGTHVVGIRTNGTLWEWGYRRGAGRGGTRLESSPQLMDGGHDWVGVGASYSHGIALRRDGTLWAWGDNSMNQLGNGPGPSHTNLVQVGTDSDWIDVGCQMGPSTIALKRDGTVWVWGRVITSLQGFPSAINCSSPVQICAETNWSRIIPGGFFFACVGGGSLWQMLSGPPGPEVRAASNCRLILTNPAPEKVAIAYLPQDGIFQIRPDGTLWQANLQNGSSGFNSVTDWHHFDKRKDWVSLWSGGGTVFGLTADGTVWFWGADQGKPPVANLAGRLKEIQHQLIGGTIGPGRSSGVPVSSPIQEKPRPLLRPVLTNGVEIPKPVQ